MTEMNRPSAKPTSVVALAATLVVLLVCGSVTAVAAEPLAAPKDGKAKAAPEKPKKKKKRPPKQRPTYWGAWIGTQLTGDQPPWDMSAVGRFSELAAKTPSLLEFAAPFADCSTSPCSFYRFPRHEMETIRNFGAIPFFSWGSQSTPVPGDLNLPDYQLADIAAGAHDDYIREFAEGARDWGHPFFLRFNWAKNGVNPQPWRSFDEIFDRSYRLITRKLAPTKPMLLAEMASGGGARAKAKWIDEMFLQLRTKYRRIRGLIWFEQIDRGVQWPIESSGAATKAFRRGIRQPGFRTNHYSDLSGSPVPRPR